MQPTENLDRSTGARTRLVNAVARTAGRVNAVQDRLVATYLDPYSVTLVYWAFAFVFLYIGLQKVVPHRSAADVQLATVGGIVGIPYVPFVTFVGAWQMLIGGLFLLRRLRLCAWFFFAYQIFTVGTLVVLREIVFQPPWLTVFGLELPWALGTYAAFVLKNLIFAAVFFVLATLEFDADGDRSLLGRLAAGASEHVGAAGRRLAVRDGVPAVGQRSATSGAVEWATARYRRPGALVERAADSVQRAIDRGHALQDHLVGNYFRPYGVTTLYWSYGFIWFYFGIQKPAPVYSPVRHPLSEFFPHLGIPLEAGMVFIGLFEMFLGILLFFEEIRAAFWLFFGHQFVALSTLFVIPFVAFQPPYLAVLGVKLPWALTGYGSFVIKNVVFVAGFALLASVELGDRDVQATVTGAAPERAGSG